MEDIWTNIARRIAGESGPSDQEKTEAWFNNNKKNKAVYDRLVRLWNVVPSASPGLPFLYRKVRTRILHADRAVYRKYLFLRISGIAAMFLLFIALSFFAWHYFTDSLPVSEYEAFNTIIVPKGNRSQIVLPDSTKVWLNNDTRLEFPQKFRTASREVKLTGEAYFEVKHDSRRPFFVVVENSRIKVLGTRFSVSAYPDDPVIETSLIEGKVVFETNYKSDGDTSYELKPGFKLDYNKSKEQLSQGFVSPSFYDYWKNGVYSFKNEDLESLARKIYRIYNTRLVFENDYLKHKTYTGTLSINDNIFTFMETIKRITVEPIDYDYDYAKNTIYLKMKRQ